MDCNQRETEIDQCLDDIREEHSHFTPISTDDLSAGPSSSNVIVTEPDRRSRSSRTMNTVRQPREWKIETEIHNVSEFTNTIQPQSTYTIRWLDTRDVNILTTAHHPTDTVFVKRTQKDGTKKEVLIPTAIAQYTLTMGGVDHFDHFRSSYPINRKCRKF
ncbi:hypothetical protein HW555_013680 [Spodoptera exigua]|uniref:PiggyBac transposable element-derived protein domain-containing protein n=1 Tax=Spodoptera exigua TaxID=7107 RepID=A0A835G2E7_SPOEX|nr:hypothetical protein HW555_013680 [Spodoptera exigua]